MSVLVWSVFEDGQRARAGVEALIESSFPPDEIRVLMSSRSGLADVPMERKTAVPAGVAVGATVGAAGAVLLAGGGALVAAGPLTGLVQAAGLGAALGSIAGAMGGLGWWKDEPEVPPEAAEEEDARVLVLIPVPEGRETVAREALHGAGAERVGALGPDAAARAHGAASLAEDPDQIERSDRGDRNAQ
jgi:hypothetical protein